MDKLENHLLLIVCVVVVGVLYIPSKPALIANEYDTQVLVLLLLLVIIIREKRSRRRRVNMQNIPTYTYRVCGSFQNKRNWKTADRNKYTRSLTLSHPLIIRCILMLNQLKSTVCDCVRDHLFIVCWIVVVVAALYAIWHTFNRFLSLTKCTHAIHAIPPSPLHSHSVHPLAHSCTKVVFLDQRSSWINWN